MLTFIAHAGHEHPEKVVETTQVAAATPNYNLYLMLTMGLIVVLIGVVLFMSARARKKQS